MVMQRSPGAARASVWPWEFHARIALSRLRRLAAFQRDARRISGPALSALAILSAVAAGAGFLPARRASGIDPIRALRYE